MQGVIRREVAPAECGVADDKSVVEHMSTNRLLAAARSLLMSGATSRGGPYICAMLLNASGVRIDALILRMCEERSNWSEKCDKVCMMRLPLLAVV